MAINKSIASISFVSLLTGFTVLGNSVAVRADMYPSSLEAADGYSWIHPLVSDYINGHAGWAIDEIEPAVPTLPPGVLARYNLTPGWATFGLALPRAAAFEGLKVGSLISQTDVKTTWADGSIRFAVVSAFISQGQDYDITAADASDGSFNPQVPSGLRLVLETDYGAAFTAALPASPTSDAWLDGPLVREWRAVVTPTDESGNAHSFLQAILEFRVYSDGQGRLDVTVENVLNIGVATSETYSISIENGAETLYSHPETTHWYLTRWRIVTPLGLSESQVTPDFEPFHLSAALPRFLTSIDNDVWQMTGADFDLMGKGGNTYTDMGTTGGRPELACYPDSTAQYVVHRTTNQHDFLLVNGDLAGSWPVHIREADGSLVLIDDRPTFWLDSRGDDKPQGDMAARGPLTPDNAHQPSWAYVPYLVTGDRYYADEMAFWANYVMLRTWDDKRGGEAVGIGDDGSFGLIAPPGNQVRGFAWGLRNMVDAAAYLPDDYPEKAYFVEKIGNNLLGMEHIHQNFSPPGTGAYYLRLYNDGYISLWQHDYLGWSVNHVHQQGFFGATGFREGLSGFQSKLFTSEPEYLRDYGAPYRLWIGAPGAGGEIEFFQTMSELFDHNNSNSSNWNRDYSAGARLMLMIQANPADGQSIFSDGFETGQTSRWSATQQ